mgnify:CR=1 FL=1|tara:strand:+ start:3872 stop:4099 length:228 start_codon:yes stop_codon:yes gene_type:complete
MESIYQFASITKSMANITASLNDLRYRYEQIAERSSLDEAHIDVLIISAQGMIEAADALKSIAYNPTTEESASDG